MSVEISVNMEMMKNKEKQTFPAPLRPLMTCALSHCPQAQDAILVPMAIWQGSIGCPAAEVS